MLETKRSSFHQSFFRANRAGPYLGASIVLGILLSLSGSIDKKWAGPGFVLAFVVALGFFIAFLQSRQAKLRIHAGSEKIEVTSNSKSVNELMEFAEKLQAYIIERSPGPKVKLD